MMSSAVPLLVTVDVEIAHDRDIREQEAVLWRLHADLAEVPMTWFCTADAAHRFAAPLQALAKAGHTIGCHGLNHGAWEDYRRFDFDTARRTLRRATQFIEDAVGVRPRVFRGPRMCTSAATQRALRGLGYRADFSICARRWDFIAASAFDRRWMGMRAAPYRPAAEDPFRRLGAPHRDDLIVVPLSGHGLPLCSGTRYLLGPRLARRLAAGASAACAAHAAPLVYLFHSYEFCAVSAAVDHRPLHQRAYPADPHRRYRSNLEFIGTLRDELRSRPMSASRYIHDLTQEPHHHGLDPNPATRDSGGGARESLDRGFLHP